jgi:hypothetical protein
MMKLDGTRNAALVKWCVCVCVSRFMWRCYDYDVQASLAASKRIVLEVNKYVCEQNGRQYHNMKDM